MIEAIKQKAVLAMLDKIGETITSNAQPISGLVKMNRLDSKFGKIETDFTQIMLYVKEGDLSLIDTMVTVRNIEYEVVESNAKSEYNGFAKIELQEVTTKPATGAWR
jgi:hypothetical protein